MYLEGIFKNWAKSRFSSKICRLRKFEKYGIRVDLDDIGAKAHQLEHLCETPLARMKEHCNARLLCMDEKVKFIFGKVKQTNNATIGRVLEGTRFGDLLYLMFVYVRNN